MGLLIIYIILCLSISCMCSVLEAVLLSTTVSFAAQKEEEGHRIAGVLKKYKADIDRPIAAILSLNTVANTWVRQQWAHRLPRFSAAIS